MIDVKLPTEEELMVIDNVVFPEEDELNSSNVISQAQVIIPGSIVLHQFETAGTAWHTYVHMCVPYTVLPLTI